MAPRRLGSCARGAAYRTRSSAYSGRYFVIVVLLPIVSVAVASNWPSLKQWVAGVAVLVTIVDFYFIDRWQKSQIKLSAQLQEEFDCLVLSIRWNEFTTGKHVGGEELAALGRRPLKASIEDTFPNWYPSSVATLPMRLARLACQRTNLWYDAKLRHHYARWVLGFELLFVVSLLVAGLAQDAKFSDVVLATGVPFVPLIVWLERERRRHQDAEANLTRLLGDIGGAIDGFIRAPEDHVADARSRQLQDAIFAHRSTSPLVSNLLYRLQRGSMEEQMKAGAEQFVDLLIQRKSEGAA